MELFPRSSEYGGIGRHKRLKISRRKVCRFESGYSYQIMASKCSWTHIALSLLKKGIVTP